MSTEINSLLLTVASQYVLEADTWGKTYGCEAPATLEAKSVYVNVMEDTKNLFNRIAPALAALGYNAYKVTIQGVADAAVSHYDMDLLVQDKFGDRVSTDSESGSFFCHCAPEDSEEILSYVNKIGGTRFSAKEDANWKISGLENWSSARRMVKNLQAAQSNPCVLPKTCYNKGINKATTEN